MYAYHFSEDNKDNKVATKLICYIRSSPSIHQLPAVYPRTALSHTEEFQSSDDLIKSLIYEKVYA